MDSGHGVPVAGYTESDIGNNTPISFKSYSFVAYRSCELRNVFYGILWSNITYVLLHVVVAKFATSV